MYSLSSCIFMAERREANRWFPEASTHTFSSFVASQELYTLYRPQPSEIISDGCRSARREPLKDPKCPARWVRTARLTPSHNSSRGSICTRITRQLLHPSFLTRRHPALGFARPIEEVSVRYKSDPRIFTGGRDLALWAALSPRWVKCRQSWRLKAAAAESFCLVKPASRGRIVLREVLVSAMDQKDRPLPRVTLTAKS